MHHTWLGRPCPGSRCPRTCGDEVDRTWGRAAMRGRARAHRPALGVTAVHRDRAGHEAHLPFVKIFFKIFYLFWPLCEACGISVPQPGFALGPLHRKRIIWTADHQPGESRGLPPLELQPHRGTRKTEGPAAWNRRQAQRGRGAEGNLSTRRASETRSPASLPRGCPGPTPLSALPARLPLLSRA